MLEKIVAFIAALPAALNKAFPYEVRKWLYGLTLASLPLLIAFGVVPVATASLWLVAIAALLNLSPNDVVDPGE